jgi:predicted esterase
MSARAAWLLVAVVAAAGPLRGDWSEIEIPATGSYALLYVPEGAPTGEALPAVVFLHGSGASPEAYRSFVDFAADAAGCALVLPRSASSYGWGTGQDQLTVSESLRLAGESVSLDPERTAIAGHSSGGAYAYLLAYTTVSGYSAVFTLSAPFVHVQSIADPHYTAPIRMYYGTDDPNYSGGSYDALMAQWFRLGVEVETDIRAGYGHNVWPHESMEQGFSFLVDHVYPVLPSCEPSDTVMCLNQDRFQLEVVWRDFRDDSGSGRVVEHGSDDSGLFWFFNQTNWEMLVKVLDGCDSNQHYWVFAAATTNVQYTLTVTDLHSGETRSYFNALGVSSPAITDSTAFQTCP